MKRIVIYTLLVFLLIFSFFAHPSQKTFADSISDNSVIIVSGIVNTQNKLIIKANLTENTAISGMTLELSYNKSAMVLTNVVFGTALSSLEPITTNTNTSEGYKITPFKFNYYGEKNDFSTGLLFTLTFNINNNVKDGNYLVSLKYNKNKDVCYFDENNVLKTKNLYIDNAEIQIKNDFVTQITSVRDEGQTSNTWIVVLCVSVLAIAIIIAGILFAKKFIKKRRNWKRL